MNKFIDSFTEQTGIDVEYVGTMQRDRVSTFLTDTDHRNWSVVADQSRPADSPGVLGLAQVEVEYKGRSGVWLEQNSYEQANAIVRLETIGRTLVERSGILNPTSMTKFQWLREHHENSTSR